MKTVELEKEEIAYLIEKIGQISGKDQRLNSIVDKLSEIHKWGYPLEIQSNNWGIRIFNREL